MFRLDKKVAIITGGASGIGKAVSLLFAVQSLRTVGIESIRIFVFSGLKKSPKEFDLYFCKEAS